MWFESAEEHDQRVAEEAAKEERKRGWDNAQEQIKAGWDHVPAVDGFVDNLCSSDDYKAGRDAAYEELQKQTLEKIQSGEIEPPWKLDLNFWPSDDPPPSDDSGSSSDDSSYSSSSDDYSWTDDERSTTPTDSSPTSWPPEPDRDDSRPPKSTPTRTTHSSSTATAEAKKKKDDDAMVMLAIFLSPIFIVIALVAVYFEQQKRDAQAQPQKPGIVQAQPIPQPRSTVQSSTSKSSITYADGKRIFEQRYGPDPATIRRTLPALIQGMRDHNPDALYLMGEAKLRGAGISQDRGEGIRLLVSASNHGSNDASIALSMHYFFGSFVDKDNAESDRWIKVGIARGDPKSIELGKKFFR